MSQSNPGYLPATSMPPESDVSYPPVTEQLVASYSFDARSLPADPMIPHPAVSQRVSAQPLLVDPGAEKASRRSRLRSFPWLEVMCLLAAGGGLTYLALDRKSVV